MEQSEQNNNSLTTNTKQMRTSNITTFSFLLVLLLNNASCQKSLFKKSPLNGTYVEMEKNSDTIVFQAEYEGQNPIFELKRGFRITEGYKLPEYYSGPYAYMISRDEISLHWFLSSGSFQSYYFKNLPEDDKLLIGNFFKNPDNPAIEKDTLVFLRIHN